MPPRIPTPSDFTHLFPQLTYTLHLPTPPESTTAILLLFHGLGDTHTPFANFAKAVNLPGVLCISIRGVNPLPLGFLAGDEGGLDEAGSGGSSGCWMWSDDVEIDERSGRIEGSGHEKAWELVMERLVRETLIGKLGWEMTDILLFGFGQGGSLALEMAARLHRDATVDTTNKRNLFKGIISIGGPLPQARVTAVPEDGARIKSKSPVLLCHGSRSEEIDNEAIYNVKDDFDDVKVVKWAKSQDSMPASREEMLPIMQFFADRLRVF